MSCQHRVFIHVALLQEDINNVDTFRSYYCPWKLLVIEMWLCLLLIAFANCSKHFRSKLSRRIINVLKKSNHHCSTH